MNSEEEFYKLTQQHIKNVREFLAFFIGYLENRAKGHDKTKLLSPEKETFIEFTPKLKNSTYGSKEYAGFLENMKIALNHHYRENRHHPEHFKSSIRGMNLIDIIEMFCDWKVATLRHKNGDMKKSIRINQDRFQYSDDLKEIFLNTVELLE